MQSAGDAIKVNPLKPAGRRHGHTRYRERTQARMLALQALALFDALGEDFAERLADFLHDPANQEDLGFAEPASAETLALARTLACDAWSAHERYDDLLRAHVSQWAIERMQPVDRNILRLGLHELLACPTTPHQVALSEAVDLAALFGGNESPAFVNGVLDGIRRELAAAAPGSPLSEREAPASVPGAPHVAGA